jgi:hypothetical protein
MSNIHKNNWWQKIEAPLQASLKQIWIPVGLPGHAGEKKVKWQELLDERFGPGYWRLGHYVRGQIISKAEAIREYEHSYRVHLRQHPDIVHFLTTFCGNVYDDNITNVHDDSYDQLHTRLNHYQDISIRRVIAELVDDITWPNVTETTVEEVDLTDLNDGQVYHLPRARGFQGRYLLQVREPETPGFFLNPAVVPVYDPALITTLPGVSDWYFNEGCGHLSVEAFWQMSKVIEVRYDKFLELKERRCKPLEGLG